MRKCFFSLVVVLSVVTASGADGIVKGGLWKTFQYDRPTKEPVVFSGASRCRNVRASDYCIYLDIWYDDGTPVWGERVDWTQGTHDWETIKGAFVPEKPVKKIEMHVFLRCGKGDVEFKDLALERREGRDDVLSVTRMTSAPYENVERQHIRLLSGRRIVTKEVDVANANSIENPLADGDEAIWICDSMRRVSPLTFPGAEDRAADKVSIELARHERESFQVQISTGAKTEWKEGGVKLPVLRDAQGRALKGNVVWERIGYIPREFGYFPHTEGVPAIEKWIPDPLLPAAPFRVRAGSTQGLWFTVYAAPDASPGVYSGDIVITESGKKRGTVRVSVRVRDFAQPAVFGMHTAFSIMDGFTRAWYPDDFAARKRQGMDIMLDHRLNPDDISRTEPPAIADLLYARKRGMNNFNILNIVPELKDTNELWVCFTPREATEDPAFYPAFKKRLAPYVEKLRKHGLDKIAYLYGFDEREKEYYPGIDAIWRKLKHDFPDIPVMTTAMMYRDMAAGKKDFPCLDTTDWYCPLTSVYRKELSDELRRKGKKVWWYTCCVPVFPYANSASIEYPWIEGRLIGWMTHLYRVDGFLYWHVNYWSGNGHMDESDTFFPKWRTYNRMHMPGDGIYLYPGRRGILPSIRLAQIRDGVEDYEWLRIASAEGDAEVADAESRKLVESMVEYTRDFVKLRTVRTRLADYIERQSRKKGGRRRR